MASNATSLIDRSDTPEYRKSYARGYRYSGTSNASLDSRVAIRNEDDDAWMDGYLDYAAGREYLHLLYCEDHTGH